MVKIPVFRLSRGGGNWQLFSPLPAPSRINRPGRIRVQTVAEKWTTQDYRCVQRDEVKFGRPTEPLPLYRSDPFQKALNASTCKRQTRTPDGMTKTGNFFSPHGTISSAWTRER